MKLSARNQIKGRIVEFRRGATTSHCARRCRERSEALSVCIPAGAKHSDAGTWNAAPAA